MEEEEGTDTIRADALILEEWKTVIQTQMHFNEMLMKMRTAAVTIALAFFGAAAVSLQYDKMFLTIGSLQFHAGVLIIALGLGMLAGVFCLDYYYYFRMLLGAVGRGYEIDEAYKDKIPGYKVFGMTSMIRDSVGDNDEKNKKNGRSRRHLHIFGKTLTIRDSVSSKDEKNKRSIRSRWLIRIFYGTIVALGILFMLSILLGYSPPPGNN
jgi:hypothetical protein